MYTVHIDLGINILILKRPHRQYVIIIIIIFFVITILTGEYKNINADFYYIISHKTIIIEYSLETFKLYRNTVVLEGTLLDNKCCNLTEC